MDDGRAARAPVRMAKGWAARYAADLWALLGDRYVLYGEWLYGKHSIFYTDLPHYLLEFDIYDTHEDVFLATEQRQQMLRAAPYIASVRVIHAGQVPSLAVLQSLVGPSPFIAPGHREQLAAAAQAQHLDRGAGSP